MHTYIKTPRESALWTVGHYRLLIKVGGVAEQVWQPMKDFGDEAEAARYVNFLNGGEMGGA